MVEAVAPIRSRRLPFWAIIIALVISALAGVFVLLWFKLPTWAPAWVVEHSPWVDPIMRAVHADRDLGTHACDRIIGLGSTQVPNILVWLNHSNPRIRSLAAESLGLLRDPRALSGLQQTVSDPDPDVAQNAIIALGRIGDERSVPTLAAALWRFDLHYGNVVASLRQMPHRAVADAVLPLPDVQKDKDNRFFHLVCGLNDPRAVVALQEVMRTPRLVPLADGIIASLATRQETAAHALAILPHPEAVPALIAAFSDPEEQVRLYAVAGVMLTYGQRLDPRLLQRQILALDDPHPKVRMLAALSFRFIQESSVEPKLLKLSQDSDPQMRSYAVNGLGSQSASERAIARLAEAMRDPFEKVAVSAVSSLAGTENVAVLSLMIAELSEAKGKVRDRILQAFAARPFSDDARVFPYLIELLSHPKQYQHGLARSALRKLKLTDEQQKQMEDVIDRRQATQASP